MRGRSALDHQRGVPRPRLCRVGSAWGVRFHLTLEDTPTPSRGRGTRRTQKAVNSVHSLALRILVALIPLATLATPLRAADDPAALLTQAKTHLEKGRYEEALEVFRRAATAKADPVAVALGESQTRQAVGAWEEAEKTIVTALATAPQEPRLLARRAELHLLRGQLAEAEKVAESVRRLDRENLLARLVQADVAAETGRLDEANESYRYFIRYYNERQPEDAASLLSCARGSIQYARWNHNAQIFNFVVNTLCPDALKNDANAWQAHTLQAELLLEKFNREQAIPELDQALAINPRSAEAITLAGQDAFNENDFDKTLAKAAEALKINPRFPEALRLKADASFLLGRIGEAHAAATAALAINPRDAAIELALPQESAISVPSPSAVLPPKEAMTSPPMLRSLLMSAPYMAVETGFPVSPLQ